MHKKINARISSSIFAWCMAASYATCNITTASADDFTSANDGQTILNENLTSTSGNTGAGIFLDAATNMIFDSNNSPKTPITAENNDSYGVFLKNASSATFNGDFTTTNNNNGGLILENDSSVTFNGAFTSDNDNDYGIFLNNASSATFNGAVSVTNNDYDGLSLFLNNTTVIFNGTVLSNYNASNGIYVQSPAASLTFNEAVTTNNNDRSGIIILDCTATFNKAVTASNNAEYGIHIRGDTTATFNGAVTANYNGLGDIYFQWDANTANFNNSVVDATMIMHADSTLNTINFTGNNTVKQQIGTALLPIDGTINFNDTDSTKMNSLNADIYFTNISFGPSTMKIDQSLKLQGAINLNNTQFSLGSNTLTLDGDMAHSSSNGLITVNTTFDGTNAGHFFLETGTTDLSTNIDNINVNVTLAPNTSMLEVGTPQTFDLFFSDRGVVSLPTKIEDKITVSSPNSIFSAWDYEIASSTGDLNISRTFKTNAEDLLKEKLGELGFTLDSLDDEAVNEVLNIADVEGVENATDGLNRIINPSESSNSSRQHRSLNQRAITNINDRVQRNFLAQSDGYQGIAAGDATTRYGAWFTPFLGNQNRKNSAEEAGSKTNYYGATLGLDALLSEDKAVGMALTYMSSKTKHKGINVGDKTKADTYTISLYGIQELNDKWFVQGHALFTQSKIKNEEIRIKLTFNGLANSKYTSNTWGGDLIVGNHYKINDSLRLTTTAGLGYYHMNKVSYTETDAGIWNLDVNRKALNKLDLILGGHLNWSCNLNNGMQITPEVHAHARYNLLGDKLKMTVRQVSNPDLLPNNQNKFAKLVVNVGAGFMIKSSDRLEYGASYDFDISKKYTGHKGALKLKVSF